MTAGAYSRAVALLLLYASTGCSGSPYRSAPELTRSGSILIHAGSNDDFRKTECVRIEGSDITSDIDVSRYIMRELRVAGVKECRSSTRGAQLRAFYQAGPGVCIDCGASSDSPRTGFAMIALAQDGAEVARAEWQYSAGDSASSAASAFGRDLAKLISDPPH